MDELDESLFAQATVGVLSLKMPMVLYLSEVGDIHSNTSHWHVVLLVLGVGDGVVVDCWWLR